MAATPDDVPAAMGAGLSVEWLAHRIADAPAWRAYQEATAPAWRAYAEAMAPALRAYEKATAPALRALLAACWPVWGASLPVPASGWITRHKGTEGSLPVSRARAN